MDGMSYDCDKCEKSFDSEQALSQHKEDYDHSKLEDNRSLITKAIESPYVAYAGFGLAALLVLTGLYYVIPAESFGDDYDGDLGRSVPILGRSHISPGDPGFEYNSNPPTSGPHYASPVPTGFYSEQREDEALIHNIEHGQIWISYSDVGSNTTAELETLASQYPNAVVVTYRLENDAPLAVASWGHVMKLDSYNETKITAYIERHVNNSPEPFASIP